MRLQHCNVVIRRPLRQAVKNSLLFFSCSLQDGLCATGRAHVAVVAKGAVFHAAGACLVPMMMSRSPNRSLFAGTCTFEKPNLSRVALRPSPKAAEGLRS
jgi:hypothetical protein